MQTEVQRAILAAAGRYVRKLVMPFDDRLKSLEGRVVEKGEPGKDGKDGADGRDADPVDVGAIENAVVSRLLESERLHTLADAFAVEAVDAHLKANPPADGKDGSDGRDGDDGEPGKDGASPDAETVAELVAQKFERRFGEMVLGWERMARDVTEKAIEKMPAPRDGIDGIGFDDMAVEHDGERGFTIKFRRGDVVKAFPFRIPVVLDRGVFRAADGYEKGDGVTYGGQFWIAQKDVPEGAPGQSADWRLAVRKGRDRKDGA